MTPKVIIDNLVFRQIMHWVNKSHDEVSGLGTLVVEPDGVFRVTKVMLLPQTNGATHTDIEPEHVGKLMYEMRDSGDLRFWWHSHVNMAVFWSQTDMDTIENIGAGGWFLSTVFNKKREMRSAFYAVQGTITPWGNSSLFLDELETVVEPFAEVDAAQWDSEYDLNVTVHRKVNPYENWPDSVLDGYGVTALKRPVGVSKKEWKTLKRERHFQEELPRISTINPLVVTPEESDEYGLSPYERQFLAEEGWDEHDLDEFIEMGITALDCVWCASVQMTSEELTDMLTAGWTMQDIKQHFGGDSRHDDGPVMDRSRGGKYDF